MILFWTCTGATHEIKISFVYSIVCRSSVTLIISKTYVLDFFHLVALTKWGSFSFTIHI